MIFRNDKGLRARSQWNHDLREGSGLPEEYAAFGPLFSDAEALIKLAQTATTSAEKPPKRDRLGVGTKENEMSFLVCYLHEWLEFIKKINQEDRTGLETSTLEKALAAAKKILSMEQEVRARIYRSFSS